MTNWCSNELIITGDRLVVQSLLEQVRSPQRLLDFEKIVPYPTKYTQPPTEEIMKVARAGWCLGSWGGTSNAIDAEIKQNEQNTIIFFDTASVPAIEAITALAQQFPDLSFRYGYEELGSDYSGYIVFEKGQPTEVKESDWVTYPLSNRRE